MSKQHTISEKVRVSGVGLHSGATIHLELLPAPVDNGISFVRTDKPGHAELRATSEFVVDTTLATTLGAGVNGSSIRVGTVEHLLAALRGLGVDNVQVLLDGAEVPVLDGSATGWVDMICTAGVVPQRRNRKHLVIKREVEVTSEGKRARFSPGRGLKIRCQVDFDHPLISSTPYEVELTPETFRRDIASARTFGFLTDVEKLQEQGLALGGTLDNAVVVDELRILNPDGLRFPDEFARHKVLDAVGDLSLFGMQVEGCLDLFRSGHALNHRLVREVLRDPRNYEIVTAPVATQTREAFPMLDAVESLA